MHIPLSLHAHSSGTKPVSPWQAFQRFVISICSNFAIVLDLIASSIISHLNLIHTHNYLILAHVPSNK